MSRAIKRHHYQRRKKLAKYYWFANYAWPKVDGNNEKTCAKIADTHILAHSMLAVIRESTSTNRQNKSG